MQPLTWLVVGITGWVQRDQQAAIVYLLEENRVLKARLRGRKLRLTDDERHRLAVKGKALGRKLLAEVVGIVTPETNRLPLCAVLALFAVGDVYVSLCKKALTLNLARGEGRERYFGCNLMQHKVLALSHQHLMAEAPHRTGSAALSFRSVNSDEVHSRTHHDSHGRLCLLITSGRMKPTGPVSDII